MNFYNCYGAKSDIEPAGLKKGLAKKIFNLFSVQFSHIYFSIIIQKIFSFILFTFKLSHYILFKGLYVIEDVNNANLSQR